VIECRQLQGVCRDKRTSAAAPLFPYPADHRPAHHPAEPDAVIGEHAGHHYGGTTGSGGHCRRGAGKPNLFSIEYDSLWHILWGGNLCGPVLGQEGYCWSEENTGAGTDFGGGGGNPVYAGGHDCTLFFDRLIFK